MTTPGSGTAGAPPPTRTPGVLEMRGAYVVFALLAALDVLVLLRAAQHWRGDAGAGALSPDALLLASVLAALLLAVQGLLAWLFIRLRRVIRYYRLLKESYEEELLFSRQLMDGSGQGMAILDEHGRFTYTNRRVSDLLGRPEGDLLGHTLLEYTLPEDQAILRAQHEVRWQGEASRYVLRVRDASGTPRTLSVYGSPRWFRGRIVGTLLAVSTHAGPDA